MNLIFGQSDVKVKFLAQWAKYVPALLMYAKKSTKKSIVNLLFDIEEGK